MQKRKFDELVSYFNKKVSEMEVETKYKMELLGMVTALGCAHEKEMSDLSETKRDSSDLISRQAAIEALKGLPTWWADSGGSYGGAQPPMEALLDPEDAISALENLPSAQLEPCKDAVSRAEIIRLILERGLYCDTQADRETSAEIIRQLPSVQPQQIIAEVKIEGEELQRCIDEAVEQMRNEDIDEWCADCSEYDAERHCCPRYNRVIREAVEEAKKDRINCAHCKRYDRHGHRCKWWNHGVSNVDWCSYAERKEE